VCALRNETQRLAPGRRQDYRDAQKKDALDICKNDGASTCTSSTTSPPTADTRRGSVLRATVDAAPHQRALRAMTRARRANIWVIPERRSGSGSAGTEYAEFVPLGISEHNPGLLALADISVGRSKGDQALDLSVAIIRPKVEV